jgi:lipopolysaccharide export system permease protein
MLSRNSEITAMKAGGVSLYRITFPLFLIVFFIGLCSFLGNEYLVPLGNQKARYLLKVQLQGESEAHSFKNYNILYRSNNHIFSIQLIDRKKKTLNGFTLFEINDQFRCIQRIDANEVKWINGKWKFFNGSVINFDERGSIRSTPFKEIELFLTENWESFQGIEQESEEMSYTELQTYVQRIQAAGYDSTRYLVDLYAKLSYPFLNFIMVLIGIPFALKTGRSGGIALSIGVSVLIGFVYGITFYVFLTFGKSGVLSPFLSAWIPTILFSLAGIFTLMSIKQ